MHNTRSTTENIVFRIATEADLPALFEIWMQDHVNPFMSFEQMAHEALDTFRHTIWPSLCKEGVEICVLEVDQKIVATQRIIPGSKAHSHSVEFGSFGVHEAYLRRGYGGYLSQNMIARVRTHYPHVKRIGTTQEMDNTSALALAKKMGYVEEVHFPDWFIRRTGSYREKPFVGERFLALFWDPLWQAQVQSQVAAFHPVVPALREDTFEGDTIGVHYEMRTGLRRSAHIAFASLEAASEYDALQLHRGLRQLTLHAAEKHKKIEILTADPEVLQVLAALGYHYRGQKIGAYCQEGKYYNEAACDFGFFDTADATRLAVQLLEKFMLQTEVLQHIENCNTAILEARTRKEIDAYGFLYLQNLVYQMVRDRLGEYTFYAGWQVLIAQLPSHFLSCFSLLDAILLRAKRAQ